MKLAQISDNIQDLIKPKEIDQIKKIIFIQPIPDELIIDFDFLSNEDDYLKFYDIPDDYHNVIKDVFESGKNVKYLMEKFKNNDQNLWDYITLLYYTRKI